MKVTCTILLAMLMLGAAAPVSYLPNAMAQVKNKPGRRYACPMHSEVNSTRPGKCPKCGMALKVVKKASASAAVKTGTGVATPHTGAPLSIPDISVLDQNGKRLNFYTDLVKGRTVAINFIFTTCTTICPPLTATFRRVQMDLGEHADRDVRLISVSVDPNVDVPERLRAFAAKFNAGPGWTFVTGERSEVYALLRALGASAADKNDHTPMVLIGNEREGYWTRVYGLSPPSTLARILAEAANRK